MPHPFFQPVRPKLLAVRQAEAPSPRGWLQALLGLNLRRNRPSLRKRRRWFRRSYAIQNALCFRCHRKLDYRFAWDDQHRPLCGPCLATPHVNRPPRPARPPKPPRPRRPGTS